MASDQAGCVTTSTAIRTLGRNGSMKRLRMSRSRLPGFGTSAVTSSVS